MPPLIPPAQRTRNLLALAQARANGRPVPEDRLLADAAGEGLGRRETEAALRQLERDGLAHRNPGGWALRVLAPCLRVSPDHATLVRLHR